MHQAVPVRMTEAIRPRRTSSLIGGPVHRPVAELALEGVRQPADVADRERLVQAVALDDRRPGRRVRAQLRPDEAIGDVARGERDEQ